MVELSPNILVIALNINNLKLTIKRKRWPEWIKKVKIQVCCYKKLISNIIGKLRVKIWKLYTMKKTKKNWKHSNGYINIRQFRFN